MEKWVLKLILNKYINHNITFFECKSDEINYLPDLNLNDRFIIFIVVDK